MTSWRGRRCRAALSSALRAAGIGLSGLVLLAVPGMASTHEASITDPRDVGTRLDLKAVTHMDDGSSIVYTAETYTPFADQAAAFKWGIDRDHDEAFDLIVITEWQGAKLVGGVKDSTGRLVAPAAVSRPAPNAVRVSFPVGVLGGAAVYRYAVDAEADGGERDLAPNSGLVQHRLGAPAAASSDAKETRTESSGPAKTQAPAPAPVGGATSGDGAATPRQASGAAPLPTTGPGDRALLPWAGGALMIGGVLVALGAQRNRVRREEVTGGIR